MNTTQRIRKVLLEGITIIGLMALIGWVFGLPKNSPSGHALNEIEDRISQIEQVLSPYQQRNTMNKVEIATRFKNSVIGSEPTGRFRKNIKVVGTLSKGYLYVVAKAGGQALQRGEDDVYAELVGTLDGNVKEYGGHLIEARSLSTPVSTAQTEMLYSLSDVKYKDSYLQGDIEVTSANWLDFLNRGNRRAVVGFSSTNKDGEIVEASLYYACSQDSQCSITIE